MSPDTSTAFVEAMANRLHIDGYPVPAQMMIALAAERDAARRSALEEAAESAALCFYYSDGRSKYPDKSEVVNAIRALAEKE